MNYKQLKAFFGGPSKIAQALDTKKQIVNAWRLRKRIPSKWQLRAAHLSDGKLQADRESQKDAAAMADYIIRGISGRS